MSEELRVILKYDVNALKENIQRHENNIAIFTKAINDAKADIERLRGYIAFIEKYKK